MAKPNSKHKPRYSVQLKFIAVFLALVVGLLVFLNTYPLFKTRDMIFSAKDSSLTVQASVIASALGQLDPLTEQDVLSVMAQIDVLPLARILVTDPAGVILYDTSASDPRVGSLALLSELNLALEKHKIVFYSRLQSGAFSSRAAMPIVSRGKTLGAVYLLEYDEQSAQLLGTIQGNLRTISLGIGFAALVLVVFFSRTLTRRITELVRAIRVVREGEYGYRLGVRGHDEVAELGDEFNNLTERLQKTEEVRRRFVSDASHELKTPLAAIRLLSDSIAQSGAMDSGTMREFVSDIGTEAGRLQRTTEKLLSLTRLDSEVENVRSPVDLKAVAESALHMLIPLAKEQDVTLLRALDDGCIVYASEDDIYQIIFNLAENGIKYNRPGGNVKLSLFTKGTEVIMLVEDTGIGIPATDMPNIFSRFYRVDKARNREAGGSGLGLSIVQDACTLHGGAVRAEARAEGGMRFCLSFPRYQGE